MVPQWISPLPLVLLVVLLQLPVSRGEIGEREDRRFLYNLFNRRPTPVEREDRSCSCTCGERNDAPRIVGGQPTGPNEFPWIVRLSYFNRFYCGGMLINDRYVLTAAHCVKGFMWFMIKVTFGEHDRCDKSFKPESRFVLRAITGDFSYLNFDNDIAILRLNDRVPMTETIRPICLPTTTDDMYVGRRAIASGWGTLKEDGKPACILQQVEVPVMSNGECKRTNYSEKIISDNMLCAGYPEGLKDSCQGDSGGPLIREKEDKRYELIGVVSWGNGCARPGFPGIYTRVTRYLDWIRSNTAGGCWCEDPPRKPSTTEDKEGTTASTSGTSTTEAMAEVTSEKPSSPTEEAGDKDKPEPTATTNPSVQKPEPTEDKNKPEQTVATNPSVQKPEETEDKNKPEPTVTTNPSVQKPEETEDKNKPEQTVTMNLPEQKPEQTEDKNKPEQTSTMNQTEQKPEQTEDKNKPEQTVTMNQMEQKPNQTDNVPLASAVQGGKNTKR